MFVLGSNHAVHYIWTFVKFTLSSENYFWIFVNYSLWTFVDLMVQQRRLFKSLKLFFHAKLDIFKVSWFDASTEVCDLLDSLIDVCGNQFARWKFKKVFLAIDFYFSFSFLFVLREPVWQVTVLKIFFNFLVLQYVWCVWGWSGSFFEHGADQMLS